MVKSKFLGFVEAPVGVFYVFLSLNSFRKEFTESLSSLDIYGEFENF